MLTRFNRGFPLFVSHWLETAKSCLLSPPRRSDLALHYRGAALPEPSFFWPTKGETHRHRGTDTKAVFTPKKSPTNCWRSLLSAQIPTQRKTKILSRRSHRRRPSFFFLHARVSVASSSGHQTAEMGAVTLHSALGNPTLRQRHGAREESATTRADQEIRPFLVSPIHSR